MHLASVTLSIALLTAYPAVAHASFDDRILQYGCSDTVVVGTVTDNVYGPGGIDRQLTWKRIDQRRCMSERSSGESSSQRFCRSAILLALPCSETRGHAGAEADRR